MAQKLWLLRAREDLPREIDPWNPWYDKAFGFVVRASTEQAARQLAHEESEDETSQGIEPWRDSMYSTCEKLTHKGEHKIILRDFASA